MLKRKWVAICENIKQTNCAMMSCYSFEKPINVTFTFGGVLLISSGT